MKRYVRAIYVDNGEARVVRCGSYMSLAGTGDDRDQDTTHAVVRRWFHVQLQLRGLLIFR